MADPNIDVVYVATPHSHHYQNVMLALEAGKNVLCEKAFTVNAAQTKILCETACKKNLFLMEAVWTRYFPLSVQVRQLIRDGEIGEVLRTTADTSFGDDIEEKWDNTHRMVNPDLAGGCLLDCKYSDFFFFKGQIVQWVNLVASGHLLPHLGIPNSLPHSSQRAEEASYCCLADNSLPSHRCRRGYYNPAELPNQHPIQWSAPAAFARCRNDQCACCR